MTFAAAIFAQEFERKVLIPPLKENSSRYFYLPFEVPAETKSLTLSYNYDKKGGANVLDLGVFDARFDESEKSVRGFRGWSGGRRSEIFISETAASNGYLAVKIPAGKWRVILGLYKVAPEGVEVTVKVKFIEIDQTLLSQSSAEEEKTYALPALEKLPAPESFGGYRWFRGDLHMHTYHSDGNWTIPLILAWANAAGLDFVGLTDHNTTSHHAEINRLAPPYKNLLVLRGEEVTTYGGHFNVWGLPTDELIDFRVTPKDAAKLQNSIDDVHRLGLIASINHPTALCGGCDWSYGDWTKMDSVEIWNGVWDFTDEAALKKWDALLQNGKKIPALGSSDTHQPPIGNPVPANGHPIGEPTDHVGMKNLSQSEFLSAIKQGRVWISDESKNYVLEFSVFDGAKHLNIGDEDEISNKTIRLSFKAANFPDGASVALVSDGKKLLDEKISGKQYGFDKSFAVEKNSYFRIEIRDAENKMLALTNPIFVKIKR